MESNKTISLQDTFLDLLCKERISVSIYLSNGIRLHGLIDGFDAHVILLKDNGIVQAVYKHALSSILPSRSIELPFNHATLEPRVTIKRRTPYKLHGIEARTV